MNIYIDLANLHNESKKIEVDIDYEKLYFWLYKKFRADNIFLFTGWLNNKEKNYEKNKKIGYKYIFREVLINGEEHKIKANCDVDIAVNGVKDFYENALKECVLISSDGDYATLVKFWLEKNIKVRIISPAKAERCSYLLKKKSVSITYLNQIKHHIQKIL